MSTGNELGRYDGSNLARTQATWAKKKPMNSSNFIRKYTGPDKELYSVRGLHNKIASLHLIEPWAMRQSICCASSYVEEPAIQLFVNSGFSLTNESVDL